MELGALRFCLEKVFFEMTTKNRILLILGTLLVVGLMIFLPSCNQEIFIGHDIKNSDLYLLDVEQMNGTDSHSIELQAGAMLAVHFETVKESMHMEISAPDGSCLYAGNGKGVTEFTVNISESGTYSIFVEAHRAKGIIQVQRKEERN